MLERFFEASSFIYHISKPIQVPKGTYFGYIMFAYAPCSCLYYMAACICYIRVLYVCILINVCIQELFCFFSVKLRGWGQKAMKTCKLRIRGRMQICETHVPECHKYCFDTGSGQSTTNAGESAEMYAFTYKTIIQLWHQNKEQENPAPPMPYMTLCELHGFMAQFDPLESLLPSSPSAANPRSHIFFEKEHPRRL